MKFLLKLSLALALSLAAAISLAHACDKPDGAHKARPVRFAGTSTGAWDYNYNNGAGTWAGYMFIQFGDQPVKMARDITISGDENGEIDLITFVDGSGSFEIVNHTTVVAGDTPMLLELYQVGTITNGTGAYANVSGTVHSRGQLVAFDGTPSDPQPINPWIASSYGEIYGLAAK